MADTTRLPRWRSHKIVHAAKIVDIAPDQLWIELDVSPQVFVALSSVGLRDADDLMRVAPAPNMFARYMPVIGDYYVVYEDGYASISPRQAFEEGYHRL